MDNDRTAGADPKITSDEGWKQQAQREKEKLGAKEQPQAGPAKTTPAPAGPLPPATFITMVNSLVLQVMYCLGRLSDPQEDQPAVNLDLAKHHIDMLQVLEDKTKGNLTPDESRALALALHEMRMQYVQTAQV